MEFDDIVQNNKKLARKKQEKCYHEELDDIRMIYKRCLDCGKWLVQPDPDYVKKHGLRGKDVDFRKSNKK